MAPIARPFTFAFSEFCAFRWLNRALFAGHVHDVLETLLPHRHLSFPHRHFITSKALAMAMSSRAARAIEFDLKATPASVGPGSYDLAGRSAAKVQSRP
jgi:hypothetical protein